MSTDNATFRNSLMSTKLNDALDAVKATIAPPAPDPVAQTPSATMMVDAPVDRDVDMGTLADAVDLTDAIEFADNPEPRCPVVILVDNSGSMQGRRIEMVNRALADFGKHIRRDTLTSLRVDVAVVCFNIDTRLVVDFVGGQEYAPPPPLRLEGGTKIGNAVRAALDMVEQRKNWYRTHGATYYRPFILVLTDGRPEHDTEAEKEAAAQAVREATENRHAKVVCFGIGGDSDRDGADIASIKRIIPGTYQNLVSTDQIPSVLEWLANSLEVVSQSQPGEAVNLPAPEGFLSY